MKPIFLKTLSIFIYIILSANVLSYSQTIKPNIILILADDLGYQYLSHTGSLPYSTPNLDTMAKKGMSFTQCHSSPLCSPSRHMLLTGKYNFRNYKRWAYMDTASRTIANVLQDSGYNTAAYGKWQLNGGDVGLKKWGFRTYSLQEALSTSDGGVGGGKKYNNPILYEKGVFLPLSATVGKYSEDIFTDSVLNFIDSNQTTPFFIYYGMALAHFPFQPTPDDGAYASWTSPTASDTTYFRSMVKYMDKKVGQILDKIYAAGIQNNTYILFTTDNGTTASIYDYVNGEILRGGKGTSTDAGIHVPLIVYGPNVEAGKVNNDLIDFTDFLPTIAGLANIPIPAQYAPIDGRSFDQRIKGNMEVARTWIFNYFKPFYNNGSVKRWVQSENYKLYDSLGTLSFYNYKSDIKELFPLKDSILSNNQLIEKNNLLQVLNNFATQSAPILTNTTVLASDTIATIGATISSIGGFTSVTERGTVFSKKIRLWGLLENPLSEGNTSITAFSQTRNGLMPQTAYSCAAYAIHSNLTGFSPTLQFYTLSKAPKSQPASLAAMVGKNFISLKWSNALFPISGASKAGYLILYSTNIPFINPNANGAIPTAVIGKTTKVAIIENRLPALPSTEGTINNLSPDSLYNFMLIPFTWDGKNKTTYNYLINNALKISAKPAPSIFTWNCDSTGSWSNASNWIPIKVPSNGDSVQFISSKPTVVTNIPTLSLSQLLLKDSSKVSFIANGTRILSIGGAINNQFNISPNASLTLKGSDAILLKILTGNKASIAGKFTMIKGPHRLIGDDSLSIKFTNSGSFYAGDSVVKGFSGAPFNTTGKDSCIVFENGASYYQYEGLSPFGLKAPNSKILLRSTSNYFVRTSGITSPDFSGRTYGNLFLEKNTLANTNATGDWQFNSLSVDSGSSLLYNGSAATKVNIQGNIFSKSNDSISLLSGSGGINFIGTGIQLVGSGNGTGVITLNRINIPQGSSVNLLQNVNNTIATKISGTLNCGSSILYGTGSFNLTFAATIGIGDSNGIRSIGSLGNIQTTVRTFSSGANYIYNANGDQETGSFITTPNIATVNSLTFEGIGKTTLSSNFTVSSIHNSPYAISLKSGLLDLNGNTLNIPLDGKINSSGGNFTGNTGTINFDGKGTISGNISLPNVIISKTIDFGNASLITNSLQINNGGSVVNNAPIFGTNSTLIYNAGNTYSRGLEWSTMSGKGYPNNVVIKGNTTLDVSANGFADRTIAGNLMLGFDNTSGSLTMGAMPNKLTIGGNINIGTNTGNSTLSLSTKAGGDLYLNGNWSRTSAGALVANNRSIYFNGTSDQTIAVSGGETFSFLKINKPSGKVRLLNDLTLSTNLSFLTGNVGDISTEANSIIISSGQTVGITRLGGGFIIGTLKRFISAGSNLSYLFPTGTNAGYSPVSITFTNVTASGYITSAAFDFDHPVFPPNINNNKSVNKYWRLNNNDVILDTYKARFYFLNTDIDPQSTPSTFIVGKYSSNMWTYPLVTARSGTFTEVSGENTFGDFAIGQQGCAAPTTINAIINNPTCNGSANGNIVINTSGGTSPFDFSWTGPNNFTSNNQSVSNLDTGSYQLTVIAVDGCSIKKNYQLTQPPALSATLSFGAIACKGSSTNIITAAIGGTGNYQYTLSDGVNTTSPQVSNSFTVLAGTYTITVVDENFCSFSSKPIIINQPDSIGASISADTIACYGSTTTLAVAAIGGTGNYQYTLSDGVNTTSPQTSNSFTVLAGTYTISVVDENFCSFSSNPITINQPNAIGVSISADSIACHGSTTTLAVAATGGTGNYQYSLSDGVNTTGPQASNSFTVSAGTYSITVVDENFCSFSTNPITINQPDAIAASISADSITCHGSTTTLSVAATGGTGNYQYSLSDGVNTTGPQVSNNFTVLAGAYTITVMDENLCSFSTNPITINQPDAIGASISADSITCHGSTTTLAVAATGGTGNYQYTLSDGVNTTGPQVSNNFTVLAGTYTITVVDENLCSFSITPFTINEPDDLQVSVTIDPMICPDTVTTIHISANGGIGSFTYNVYDGVNVSPFQNDSSFMVGSGTYTITVKDGNGCKKSSQITVNPCGLSKAIEITQHADFKIKVYPNPSASDFILNVQSNSDDPLRITVFDVLGRIVGQFYGSSTKKYSFGKNLKPGIYYLKVTQNNKLNSILIEKK